MISAQFLEVVSSYDIQFSAQFQKASGSYPESHDAKGYEDQILAHSKCKARLSLESPRKYSWQKVQTEYN